MQIDHTNKGVTMPKVAEFDEVKTDQQNAIIMMNLKAWYEKNLDKVVLLSSAGNKPVSIANADNPKDIMVISDPVELKGFKTGLMVAAQIMGNFPIEIVTE